MTKDMTESSDPENDETKASILLTREQLYELVWSEPMIKVAARYNVSSNFMARICNLLNVPKPGRGYWAKLAVGISSPKSSLPDARPGDELVWPRRGQYSVEVSRLPLQLPSKKITEHKKLSISRSAQHPLINDARQHYKGGRFTHKDGYLKPDKKNLVDLVVSQPCLKKALSFANDLFLSLESNGHRVVIAPTGEKFRREKVDQHEVPKQKHIYHNYSCLWSPFRFTVVYIGTVAIGLTIIEMSEEVKFRDFNGKSIREQEYFQLKRKENKLYNNWPYTKDVPSNRLRLQAYSPYPIAQWVKSWRETNDYGLDKRINAIVEQLEYSAVEIARLIEKGEHELELWRQEREAQEEKQRREEKEKQAAEALRKSKAELFQIIDGWDKTTRIEKFFKEAEKRAASMSENERLKILERLQRARELIGSPDTFDNLMKWRAPDE